MKALIVVDGKHGSTLAIADAIRDRLTSEGIDTRVTRPPETSDLAVFDVIILGSAIYVGRWMSSMKAVVNEQAAALRAKPVFLFSSGPLGDTALKPEEIPDARAIMKLIGAREHVVFAGKLDKADLSLAERTLVKMVKAPYGDFRSWPEISAWAEHVADETKTAKATP